MKALTNINARSLADAVAAASAAAARGQAFAFSGGGTDLIQQIKDGTNQADVLINLRTVREARAVVVSPTETLIGGLITLSELAEHAALTGPWAVLREAAASVGTPQIRNAATLAGNITQRPWCWYYRNGFPCFKAGGSHCFSEHGEHQQHAIFGGGPSFSVHPSDLAPALVALGATFEVLGPDGPRHLTAAELFVLPSQNPARENTLGATDLLTGVRIPTPAAGYGQHLSENHRPGRLDPCRSQRGGGAAGRGRAHTDSQRGVGRRGADAVAPARGRTVAARAIPVCSRGRPGGRPRHCPRATVGQEWPQGADDQRGCRACVAASGPGVSCTPRPRYHGGREHADVGSCAPTGDGCGGPHRLSRVCASQVMVKTLTRYSSLPLDGGGQGGGDAGQGVYGVHFPPSSPFPATASAEGRQFNVPPSPARGEGTEDTIIENT